MQMAADPNMNYGVFPQTFCNQRVVSFQTGALNSGVGIIPGSTNTSGVVNGLSGITNTNWSMIAPSDSASIHVEPAHGLKFGASLSADWSYQELAVLRQGMDRYGNEPSIMKYIKIAARLPEKTVRDVAMRCQWMMKESSRRRKPEDCCPEKKIKERKEKVVDSSLWGNNYRIQPENKVSRASMMYNAVHSHQLSSGATEMDTELQQLLEENTLLLNRIAANLLTYQTNNNTGLFNRTRDNFTTILDRMSQMPGIMSQMPPLPISMNDKLADYILLGETMAQTHGSSHLKEERGW